MPLVSVSMFPGRSQQQKAALVAGLTQVVVDTCAARLDDVWVVITEVDRGSWALAGRLYSEPSTEAGNGASSSADSDAP